VTNELISIYRREVTAGRLRQDPAQIEAVLILDHMRRDLQKARPTKKSLFRRFWSRDLPATKGLYLYGDVGSGKSMLMDMFFRATRIPGKRRVHFHAFMQEIHHALEAERKQKTADPAAKIARDIARNVRLLCFDELQITNIADAMIVGQIFNTLFDLGVTIVTTSNRAPDDLYKNGLNRQLFLPFIAHIKERLGIHRLMTELDYRRTLLRREQTWFYPLNAASTASIDKLWRELAKGEDQPREVTVNARTLSLAHFLNGVARASFNDLCAKPLGPADFLAIADAVDVLLIDDIPRLSAENNNEAARFVTLIDALYEARCCLICSAQTLPEDLYQTGRGAFEFRRTASRLAEMQSAIWGQETSH